VNTVGNLTPVHRPAAPGNGPIRRRGQTQT
jgi:hypothetical protein